MSTKTNIFLTGATGNFTSPEQIYVYRRLIWIFVKGYIGGSVLLRFLKHPEASSFNITVLVRSPEKAEKLKAIGVFPVLGFHPDTPLVEEFECTG